MAKEEVKEAVVEETEVIDATEETEEELSPWYYFFSQGCGFCKKVEPIVEELISEGNDILLLDMAEPDNQKLNRELQAEYGKQCGTPWFINADTGYAICGYREKDVLQKWLDGEDVPEPPRVKTPPPKIPLFGATKKEEKDYVKVYNKWLKENEHMPEDWVKNQKSAKELLESPRPKTDAPRPPMGPNVTEEAIDKWGEQVKAWQLENTHLPNMPNPDVMLTQVKNRWRQSQNMGNPGTPGTPNVSMDNAKINTLEAKVTALEVKIDKIMSHFGVK